MSDEHWAIFVVLGVMAVMIMSRLDRLGKQIEAVSVLIRSNLARTEDERDEIVRDWQEDQKEAKKDARQFWIFWSCVGAAAVGWYVLTRR